MLHLAALVIVPALLGAALTRCTDVARPTEWGGAIILVGTAQVEAS
jgi:hypothetical protein